MHRVFASVFREGDVDASGRHALRMHGEEWGDLLTGVEWELQKMDEWVSKPVLSSAVVWHRFE